MPKNRIPVLVNLKYKISPDKIERLSRFVNESSVDQKPSAVVIVSPDDWDKTVKDMGAKDTNYGFTSANRVYVNGKIFDLDQSTSVAKELYTQPSNHLPELTVAHELAHLNDTEHNADWQEKHDYQYSNRGQKIIEDWKKNQGPANANYNLQSQVAARQGQFQPISAPVEKTLQPPASPPQIARAMSQTPTRTYAQQEIEQVRNQAAGQKAWMQREAATPPKYLYSK